MLQQAAACKNFTVLDFLAELGFYRSVIRGLKIFQLISHLTLFLLNLIMEKCYNSLKRHVTRTN